MAPVIDGAAPPKANAAVCVPTPACPYLAIIILAGALLHIPLLYSSVADVIAGESPPKANADVCVPDPPKRALEGDKLEGAVVQVPLLYSSVAPAPKAKAAA